ncbi:MAG: trigger factor [Ignavibacteriaceae bacterium]|nr:trigger factor [Ignavibacteriaceae bacterium]
MEVKINDLSASEKEMEVSLTFEEVKDDIKKEVLKQTKEIQMPGFRKGKVPLHLVKKMYGDALDYEASEKAANAQFWKIIKEKDINPIGQPTLTDIKFVPGADLTFKVKYEVMPELEAKDYFENELEVPELHAKDDAVDAELKQLLKSNSTNEDTDQVGDNNNFIINVELLGVDEVGLPLEGVQPQTMDIDLSNERVQKDIPEKAYGKKVGESFNFSFIDKRNVKNETGEENETEEVFYYKADIKNVKKIVEPELTEEFIKKASGNKASTEEELRAQIRDDIQSYLDGRTDNLVRSKLISVIIEKNNFTPPSTLVENYLEDLLKNDEVEAKKQGYKSYDKEAARKSYRDLAEREVKWFLLKRSIEKQENIEVTDDELLIEAEKEAGKIGLPVEKMLNYYKSANYKGTLLDEKVFDMLKGKNSIKKVDPEKYTKKEKE